MEAAVAAVAATPSTQWRVVAVATAPPHACVVEGLFPTKLAALRFLGPTLSRNDGCVSMLLAPT